MSGDPYQPPIATSSHGLQAAAFLSWNTPPLFRALDLPPAQPLFRCELKEGDDPHTPLSMAEFEAFSRLLRSANMKREAKGIMVNNTSR
jgi:hypothetical protein